MTEPKRGFIFDLDGTLVDTMPSHFVAWTEIARRHGFQFPEERFYSLGGVPTAEDRRDANRRGRADASIPVALALEKEQMLLRQPGGRRRRPAHRDRGRDRPPPPQRRPARGRVGQRAAAGHAHARGARRSPTGSRPSSPPRTRPATSPSPTSSWRRPAASASSPPHCTVYEDTDIGLEAARRAGMTPVDVRPLILRRAAPAPAPGGRQGAC